MDHGYGHPNRLLRELSIAEQQEMFAYLSVSNYHLMSEWRDHALGYVGFAITQSHTNKHVDINKYLPPRPKAERKQSKDELEAALRATINMAKQARRRRAT